MSLQSLYDNLALPSSPAGAIRLLRYDRSTAQWRLSVHVFDSACPRYKALSYHWGSASDTLPIRCNDREINITRNLHAALTHFSKAPPLTNLSILAPTPTNHPQLPLHAGHRIWIDAICINQQDKTEQAQQVNMMRAIYSRALSVLIWLSPSLLPKNTPACVDACKVFASRWRHYGNIAKFMTGAEEDSSEAVWKAVSDWAIGKAFAEGGRNPLSDKVMAGMLKILEQPYWSRVWIIQEICLAPHTLILAGGGAVLPWPDFKVFLIMMEKCMSWLLRDLGPDFRFLGELTRIHADGKPEAFPDLGLLLARLRWSSATDPRDKVYGLLGLVLPSSSPGTSTSSSTTADEASVNLEETSESDVETTPSTSLSPPIPLTVSPSTMYTISVAECYTRAAFGIISQANGRLDLLIHCLRPSFLSRLPDLPSWAPDWSYDASMLPQPSLGLTRGNPYHRLADSKIGIYGGYSASGTSPPVLPTLKEGHILGLRGMVPSGSQVAVVCRPLEISHRHLGVKTPTAILEPIMPRTWDQFRSSAVWNQRVWSILASGDLAKVHLVPMNAYRQGKAMDILLEYARLAESDQECPLDKERALATMFLMLVKGPRGLQHFQHGVTDFAAMAAAASGRASASSVDDATVVMAAELQEFRKSLRRNPVLVVLEWSGIPALWPGLYHFALGVSYNVFGGIIRLAPVLLAVGLFAIAAAGLFGKVPWWVWSAIHLWANWGGWGPPRPLWLDAMLSLSMDYALARLEDGRMALVPHCAEVGDSVALLQGSTCPFVVKRKWWGQWVLVGDCCVDGMMEGEAWREEEVEAMEFI